MRNYRSVDFTPTTVVGAVSTGDVIVETQEVKNFVPRPNDAVRLVSVTVLDKDDQGTAIDVMLLRSDVAVGTANAAVSITDADAVEIVAIVSVPAASFVDLINSRYASVKGIGKIIQAAAGTRSMFVSAVCRSGTPTYSASGLALRFGMEY